MSPLIARLNELLIPEISWTVETVLHAVLAVLLAVIVVRWGKRRRTPPPSASTVRRSVGSWAGQEIWRLLLAALFAAGAFGYRWLFEEPAPVFQVSAIVTVIWLLAGLGGALAPAGSWGRLFRVAGLLLTTLYLLVWFDNTVQFLDNLSFQAGHLRLSLYEILKGLLVLTFTVWGSLAVSQLIERRVIGQAGLSPTLEVLLSKVLKIVLVAITFLVAVHSMGIDLTALTVLGGGLSVGLGFGLQKIVANLVCGFILLADRSIKPGDVVELPDGTFGWIDSLHARYASVRTRDAKAHLIPNEDFVSQRVVNWSFSSSSIRLHLPVGISYHSDVRLAMRLVVQAMQETARVLPEPAPLCAMTGFGDSSVSLEGLFWIDDPTNGILNVKSDVLLRLWDLFHANGIEIPYPQRDLHIIGPLRVSVASGSEASEPGPRL